MGSLYPILVVLFVVLRKRQKFISFCFFRWVKEVWALLEIWCKIKTFEIVSMEQLLSTSHCFLQTPLQKKIMHSIILTTIWFIWKVRNDLVFNLTVTSQGKVVSKIKATSFLWRKNRGKGLSLVWEKWCLLSFTIH